MKTLDEVIDAVENCYCLTEPIRGCDQCPYFGNCNRTGDPFRDDVIHYLKEYREKQFQLSAMFDEYQAAVAENPNEPLTWEELKQMFHKPVWIETTAKKGWNIIVSIDSADMQVIHTAHRGPKLSGFSKADLGKTWQAYRKERE